MRTVSFIILLFVTAIAATSCQPAKQGGYEAPAKGNESEAFQTDVTVKLDSSIEKAVAGDSLKKRDYHL